MYNYFVYRGIDNCTPINSQWILSLISIIKSQFQISESMSKWLLHKEYDTMILYSEKEFNNP